MNKLLGLLVAGAVSMGAAGAHAQALTSASTLVAENPMLVGIGAVVGIVQVSSSVSTGSLTLQIPNPGRVIGTPSCVTYNITGAGPKPVRYVYSSSTGVVTVTGSNMTSGTLAVDDQITCSPVYRP
jgi:hypothetical protein